MRDAQDTNRQTVGGTAAMFGGNEPRPAFAVDERNTVQRFFPGPVRLTLPDHTQRQWNAGLQDVPAELADHPWLKSNGVVEPAKGQVAPQMMLMAHPNSQAAATAIAQSGVYDATLVPTHETTDEDVQAADQMAGLAAENLRAAEDNLEKARQTYASAVQAVETSRERALRRRGPDNERRLEGPGKGERMTKEQRDFAEQRAREQGGGGTTKELPHVDKLTATQREDYDKLETDEQRDRYIRAARADNLTDKMREDYDELKTNDERDALLDSKNR
jgi:hypothetical protein